MKKFFIFVSIFCCLSLFLVTSPTFAQEENLISTLDEASEDEDEIDKEILPTSFLYNLVKVKEFIQLYVLTWDDESKVDLLEDFSSQRVDEIIYAESIEDYDAIELALERYDEHKEMAMERVGEEMGEGVMERIRERTLSQQKLMTQVQLRLENQGDLQQNMVEVQTKVVGKVKDVIEVVEGEDAAEEFDEEVTVVWMDPNADEDGNLPPLPEGMGNWEYAPGTEGRNDGGAVIEYLEVKEDSGNGNGGDGQETEVEQGQGGSGQGNGGQ